MERLLDMFRIQTAIKYHKAFSRELKIVEEPTADRLEVTHTVVQMKNLTEPTLSRTRSGLGHV